jgi:chemotaxis protein methyltransferase CheR
MDLKFELVNNPIIFKNFINEIVVNVSDFLETLVFINH